MKNIAIFLALLSISISTFSQDDEPVLPLEKRKEIEAQKVGYLTSRLELTPDEAQKFWPIYNEFQQKLVEHRQKGLQKLRNLQANIDQLSEAELLEKMRYRFEHEREKISIEETYFNKFREIIPAIKIARLYQAEKDFKRELLRRVAAERGIGMDQRRERVRGSQR